MFVVVVGRLSVVQVLDADRYNAFGESQRVRSVTLPADRGSIFDRNGNDLALSIPQRTVWADPRLVTDPKRHAALLSPVLNVAPEVLEAKLGGGGAFTYLARRVPDGVADAVEKMKLNGIFFVDEPKRFAPSGDMARSVLGAVGVDNEGLSGLEAQFDDALTGKPGELIIERDPDGRTIASGEHRVEPAERGDDLILTLDRTMQYETERALGNQIEAVGAKGGIAVVMRPRTGEIIALANMSADPETGLAAPTGNNMALTAVFEPGSVNKMITVAGALEDGLVGPQTKIEVPDHLQVSDHLFSDHDDHATADYTVTRIMAESLNVGTIKIGQMLGKQRIDHYLRSFGFGEQTALDFPNESGGLMLDPDKWSGTSIGSIPIGQGIAVTAVQMLSAFNVIANDGTYVPPALVLETVDAEGHRHAVPLGATREVVSAATASKMQTMLSEVVTDGTAASAAIDGYEVAGKTGTARKPQPNGGYKDAAGRYHYVATFAGFVPAQNPELSVIVVIDEPSSTIYGGAVAAPVFSDLAKYGLRLFKIPPVLGQSNVLAPDETVATPAKQAPVRAATATTSTTIGTSAAPRTKAR
jgi:cell division protein FtsI (penicillin-binding protein 3)